MNKKSIKNMPWIGAGLLAGIVAGAGIFLFHARTTVVHVAPPAAPGVPTVKAKAEAGDAAAQNVLGDL